jgi:hypothetical protein
MCIFFSYISLNQKNKYKQLIKDIENLDAQSYESVVDKS